MMQNNETLFNLGEIDIDSGGSTSSQGQSDQESSNPLKGDSSSLRLTQQLPVESETKERSMLGNLDTEKTTAKDDHESVEIDEKGKMLRDSAEKDIIDIATNRDAKINTKKEKRAITDPNEDIKDLIEKNLVQIKSMSVINEIVHIGVEIDFDSSSMSEASSPKKLEQDSSPSKKTNSPGTPEKKRKSSSSSPSKSVKLKDNLSVACESRLTIDYSDPNILNFLSKRLLSILSYRKTCMEQIHNCFKNFLKDACDFNNTILNLNFVSRHLPMEKESYFNDDLKKLRNDLINKAENMLEKVKPFVKIVENDTEVLEECLKEINIFEKERVPLLSTKDESIPTFDDLKRFELRLKEICKKADDIVILEDERRAVLLNSSSDFEWLVKQFVKFLIITELLKPY
ncbi:unnamed protein product [Larinioides sclopetarius]|uniref:Uncharacterized protein n=1 Tax=Larinioides sclopetarius TaxID=280406 RepID=A0AAV1ZJF5_9ARAC